jgi:hypothetical protein
MTYQTNIPNSGQSPGLFPAQANANFTRLKTIVGANHKFNDTAATDDGYHQDIKILPIAVPGTDATIGQLFANTAISSFPLSYVDGLNNLYQITPTLPVRAAVNFSVTPVTFAITINYSQNVASVVRTSNGLYTITFTIAMPSNFYIASGMCMFPFGTNIPLQIQGNATYGNSVTTGHVKIDTGVDGTSSADPINVMLLISGG